MCYCIKNLVVDFNRIDEDRFSVRDRSVLTTADLEEAQNRSYKLKISKNSREVVILDIPVNGCKTFSSKELGIACFDDDCYCLEVESCDRLITQDYCYMPDLKCAIEEAIMKTDNDREYREMQDEYEKICILQEHGKTKEARLKYEQLCQTMRNCAA